jgi:hypothetical protein
LDLLPVLFQEPFRQRRALEHLLVCGSETQRLVASFTATTAYVLALTAPCGERPR